VSHTSSTPPVGVDAPHSGRGRPSPSAAAAIVAQLAPKSVLAAGNARAGVVDELRALGVAVDELNLTGGPGGRDATGRHDLVLCVGAPDPAVTDAGPLVAALAAGDAVLFSAGGPEGSGDDGVAAADQGADWARLFAEHQLFRDLGHDARYLAPDAMLLRRSGASPAEVVQHYEQALYELRARTDADVARLEAEVHQLRKEVLRTRDIAFGRQAELASAQARVAYLDSQVARYDNVEQRLHDVLNSRSWRLTQTIGLPVRMFRQRH
jgi:hypothetical protein